jgi:hypothetical protein
LSFIWRRDVFSVKQKLNCCILSRDRVNIDGVWIGNGIFLALTLVTGTIGQ